MRLQQSQLKAPTRIPSDPLQRAWVALGRVSQSVQCHVEEALKQAGFPELSWYTVLWELKHGSKDGSLSEGQSVKAKDGMIFDVTQTNRS